MIMPPTVVESALRYFCVFPVVSDVVAGSVLFAVCGTAAQDRSSDHKCNIVGNTENGARIEYVAYDGKSFHRGSAITRTDTVRTKRVDAPTTPSSACSARLGDVLGFIRRRVP